MSKSDIKIKTVQDIQDRKTALKGSIDRSRKLLEASFNTVTKELPQEALQQATPNALLGGVISFGLQQFKSSKSKQAQPQQYAAAKSRSWGGWLMSLLKEIGKKVLLDYLEKQVRK